MVKITHEKYIQEVATLVIRRVADKGDVKRLKAIKLVYGAGGPGLRGSTYFEAWKNGKKTTSPFVEICAFGESQHPQLAGTTIHELGHVLAGPGHGHGKGWKDACKVLGLRISEAAGQEYQKTDFDDDLWRALKGIKKPTDGAPCGSRRGSGIDITLRPCGMGIGTRGGKARGPGSGSRLLKVTCEDCGYTCRVTRKWLDVGPPHCPNHGAMVESV